MENIYTILLFLAPGLFVKEVREYIVKEKRIKQPIYQYLFEIVVDSVIIVYITIHVLYRLFGINLFEVDDLVNSLNNLNSIAIFIAFALIIAFIWYFIKYYLVKPLFLILKNLLLKSEYVRHTGKPCVWDSMMSDPDLKDSWLVISIFRDDKYVTSGMIAIRSSTNSDELEFALEHKEEVERLKEVHKEIFTVWYEYYNITSGLRIIFYEQKKIQEHWYMLNK